MKRLHILLTILAILVAGAFVLVITKDYSSDKKEALQTEPTKAIRTKITSRPTGVVAGSTDEKEDEKNNGQEETNSSKSKTTQNSYDSGTFEVSNNSDGVSMPAPASTTSTPAPSPTTSPTSTPNSTYVPLPTYE